MAKKHVILLALLLAVCALSLSLASAQDDGIELPRVLVPLMTTNVKELNLLGAMQMPMLYTSPLQVAVSNQAVAVTGLDGMYVYALPDAHGITTDEAVTPDSILTNDFVMSDIVAFSPDGMTLAAGDSNGLIRLWDVETSEQVGELAGHTSKIWSISFSPDGTMLAAGADDSNILVWDLATGEVLYTFEDHGLSVLSVDFSPDSTMLASGSADDSVRLWMFELDEKDEAATHAYAELQGHAGDIWRVDFGPDGTTLASGDSAGVIRVWDVAASTETLRIKAHIGRVSGLTFSPSSALIASSGDDMLVHVWDATEGSELATMEFPRNTTGVLDISFSPNGTMLVATSAEPVPAGYLASFARFWGVTADAACEVGADRQINLRSGPGTNFDIAQELLAGEKLFADGQTRGTDGYTWYHLMNDTWVRQGIVVEQGDCSMLPERSTS